jgi:thiol:disulfide interchange protein DsbC
MTMRILLLPVLALVFGQAIAKPQDADATKIRSVLNQHFPELVIDDVKPSPVDGVYQVMAGARVIYISKDGRYALNGDMIDLQDAQNNLTEEVRKQARLKGLKDLGQDNMIVFAPKDPKYTVTVFTDVDCGYCRKMQSEMAKINELGIAVRYLAFPRSGKNTPTFDKMVSVWCAKDKKQAINLAKQDKPVEHNVCPNNHVQKEFDLGIAMGVQGTPTLIFEDGTMVPGYLPPEKLLEAAEHLSKKKV